jgi:hypothetical protein
MQPGDRFFRSGVGMNNDPFAMMSEMHNQMNRMFGSMFNDPFFSSGIGNMHQQQSLPQTMFNDPFFSSGFGNMHQQQSLTQARLPPTVIEEVSGDHPVSSTSRPIIEEPDGEGETCLEDPCDVPYPPFYHMLVDEAHYEGARYGQSARPQQQDDRVQLPFSRSFPSGGGATTYAFSSSSYTSNQNGVTYQKSSTARMGPGGVGSSFEFSHLIGLLSALSHKITRR